MCDCQEPNTVSSLSKEGGHISLISISSLSELHCPDQSVTEDDPKWDSGGKDRMGLCLFEWILCCRCNTMCLHRSCLTRAGAAGKWWWNRPVAMETTASHRIPRTMECHDVSLIFPDTWQTWPHTTAAISKDQQQAHCSKSEWFMLWNPASK